MFFHKKNEETKETQIIEEESTEIAVVSEPVEEEPPQIVEAFEEKNEERPLSEKEQKEQARQHLKEAKKQAKAANKEAKAAEKELNKETEKQKKRRKLKGKIALFFCLFIVVLLGIGYLVIWPLKQKTDELTLELGTLPDTKTETYLSGNKYSMLFTKVNATGVDTNHVGDYELLIEHGSKNYAVRIHVVDTTAPVITERTDNVYLALGQEYALDELVESIEDASDELALSYSDLALLVDLTKEPTVTDAVTEEDVHDSFTALNQAIKTEKSGKNTIILYTSGVYSLVLTAADPSGNETSVKLVVTADTAPSIENLTESYVTVGSEAAVKERIRAIDDMDGDLSSSISLSMSTKEWMTEGDYELTCTVTDSYGLTAQKTVPIHIVSEETLQKLIESRTIRTDEVFVYGISEIYNAGATKTESLEAQEQYMLPTAVHLENAGVGSGSGFILYMNNDFIYICSNAHVVDGWSEGSTVNFYDGLCVTAECIGMNSEEDVAILRIPAKDVAEKTRKNLHYVNYDPSAFETAVKGNAVVFIDIIGTNGFEYARDGVTEGLTDLFSLVTSRTLVNSVATIPGNSGSALLDEKGNLVGMAAGYHYDHGDKTYIAITADVILRCFEELAGEGIYEA